MRECRSDLVLRERRGKLSNSDELLLAAHLETCEECRLLRDVGGDFDSLGPSIDDGARIERLAARVAARPRRRALPKQLRPLLFAASLTLLIGVAAAAYGLRERGEPVGAKPAVSAVSAPASVWAPREALASSSPASERLEPAPESVPANAPSASTTNSANNANSANGPFALGSGRSAGVQTAAQLFRRANELRRAGESKPAIAAYRALQHDFPGSAEATLSQVSLGGLLLNRGFAASALSEFERYLQSAPNGTLASEALYGRARALQGLGRAGDEKKTWQQLLARFPNAPYAASARRRLSELGE